MRGIAALLALPALVFLDAARRRHRLLFATQNLVTALAALRLAQLTDPIAPGESVPVLAALLLGILLAWLVARAFPQRPGWI